MQAPRTTQSQQERIEQLHLTEILYCEATPIIRGAGGLETAFAVASVLIAQHLEPSMFVPAQ